MKTVGQILKEERVYRGYSLDFVEKETKIRKKFLQAIENDAYDTLPSQAYAKGFVKNYSQFLDMDINSMMAFFRRQTQEVKKSKLLPKGVVKPLNSSTLRLTPGRFIASLMAGLLLSFLVYFGLQYRAYQSPPQLEIRDPTEDIVTSDTRLEILGITDSDATIEINGTSVLVRDDGEFYEQVVLGVGMNEIEIIATSRFGKETTQLIRAERRDR